MRGESSRSEKSKRIFTWTQILTAISVALVSYTGGYSSGYTAPAQESLEKDFNLTTFEFSWLGGSLPLAAVPGSLICGPLLEIFGRRWLLFATEVLFVIGWVLGCVAQNYGYLLSFRIIAGFAMGMGNLVFPLYLSETIHPNIRGTLGLFPTILGNGGIVICYMVGLGFKWKGITVTGCITSLPFLFLFWLLPETPRYLIYEGKTEQCRKALMWLANVKTPEPVEAEYQELMKISSEKKDTFVERVQALFLPIHLKSLGIVLGLMFIQQLSGINAIIFYATKIFADTKSDISPRLQTIIVGCVNLVATLVASAVIDHLGRTTLLYVSAIVMSVTMAFLGIYFYAVELADLDLTVYGWIPLMNVVVYVFGFSFGFGPVPWLMMGELLPAKVRGTAGSVATAFNFICSSLVTTAFNNVKHVIGAFVMFWIFALVSLGGLMFCIFLVPETKLQSLEEIELKMAEKRE